jgi:hypothetical protein
MAYRTVEQIPAHHVQGYDAYQKETFLKAYNRAYNLYGDVRRAVAEAQGAARKMTARVVAK